MLTTCLFLELKYLEVTAVMHYGATFSTLFQTPLFPSLAFLAPACDRKWTILVITFHLVIFNILPYLNSASKPKTFFGFAQAFL